MTTNATRAEIRGALDAVLNEARVRPTPAIIAAQISQRKAVAAAAKPGQGQLR